MKQSRRKELKTNELSIWLNDLFDSLQRNANYILGGVLVVLLVVVATFVIRHNRASKVAAAWNTYYDLRSTDYTKDPDVLNRARDLASAWAGDSQLGPFALQLSGDIAYNMAMSATDKAQRVEKLKQAKDSFERMLSNYSSNPEVSNAARASLAAIEESLVIEGSGSEQRARELYQQIIAAKPNAFAELADQKLKTLDERLKPLQIIATRPAEPAATAPAGTRPAASPTTTPAQ